ncbi:MAG: DNA primase DnaG, partial [Candidatus Methanomethylophilaceae archaeon]|nr:DNA primase DnaG [Candidatus Methanomethylophilaceae archaeon]
SGRIGRIEVEVSSKGGKSEGVIYMSSSLDQVETAILASALETVDRIGPCKAGIKVLGIEDVRVTKREMVVERAKELLNEMIKQSKGSSFDLTDSIRQSIQIEEITSYGRDKCPAGPNVKDSESIIIVEGRSDVLNLLKCGIKNAIAVEGTNIPKTVQDLSRERVATAFVDGDRGGELILRELFQVAEIDFVARAPRAHEVEELTPKQVIKCLRNKVPGDQYMEMNGIAHEAKEETAEPEEEPEESRRPRGDRRERGREERPRREERSEGRFSSEAAERFKKKEAREEKPAEDAPEEKPAEGRPRREERSEGRFSSEAAERFKKKEAREEKPAEDAPEEKPERTAGRSLRAKKEPVKNVKVLSPEQEKYRDMLLEMSSTHNAKLLNKDNEVVREVAVKSLVNSLKEDSEGVTAIVFDGVISQRIVDVSAEKCIGTVVGTRKGNITKMPAGLTLWTKENLY